MHQSMFSPSIFLFCLSKINTLKYIVIKHTCDKIEKIKFIKTNTTQMKAQGLWAEEKVDMQVITPFMVASTEKSGGPVSSLIPTVLFTSPPAVYSFPHSLQPLGLSCQFRGDVRAPEWCPRRGPSLPTCLPGASETMLLLSSRGGNTVAGIHNFPLDCFVWGLV